ncbi:MAG: OB-fold nucleic acid binding domain-containing protein, partial [Candidatus Woesearchaeota archaeon]
MKVEQLQANSPVEEITLKISEVQEPREVRDGQLKVANATGKDDSGSVTLTLWNDDINKVKTGDTIKITKGWAGEYQGKIQLSAGKFGTLEVLESAPESKADDKP